MSVPSREYIAEGVVAPPPCVSIRVRHRPPEKLLSRATDETTMSSEVTKPELQSKLESVPTPRRRIFTGEYKGKILAECDSAKESGQIGAILRREGLYSSHLVDWRARRTAGGETGLAARKTGRPRKDPAVVASTKEQAQSLREITVLKEKLRRAEIIIDAQKKLAEVLAFLPLGLNS